MDNEKLCFVQYIGTDIDGNHIYDFLFTDDSDNFWCINGEYFPSGLCDEITPNEGSFNIVKRITSQVRLGLIQNSLCHSLQDCIDGIEALAYEDISDYDAYPEEGRLVFHFGENYEKVEYKLAKKGILMEEKNGED